MSRIQAAFLPTWTERSWALGTHSSIAKGLWSYQSWQDVINHGKYSTKQFYCIQALTEHGLCVFLDLMPRGARE